MIVQVREVLSSGGFCFGAGCGIVVASSRILSKVLTLQVVVQCDAAAASLSSKHINLIINDGLQFAA